MTCHLSIKPYDEAAERRLIRAGEAAHDARYGTLQGFDYRTSRERLEGKIAGLERLIRVAEDDARIDEAKLRFYADDLALSVARSSRTQAEAEQLVSERMKENAGRAERRARHVADCETRLHVATDALDKLTADARELEAVS